MKNDIDIYEDDIDLYIDEYIESRGLDRNKIPSSQWAACMMFVNQHTFRNGDSLRNTRNRPYEYNLDAVQRLLNKYIFLCSDYCQRVCIEHFCLLSGITRATINYWANDLRRSNDEKAKQIYATLMDHSMMAADDLMISKSGVNSIAYRNAVNERYNAFMAKQEEKTAIDTAALERQLGIDNLALLPEPETRPEASKKPWESEEFLEGIEIL